MKLSQIAEMLSAKVIGNSHVEVISVNPLNDAGENDLSFFAPKSPATAKMMLELAKSKKIGAILVKEHVPEILSPQILVSNPLHAIIGIAQSLHKPITVKKEIHKTAIIDESAKIGKDAAIGAFVVIGENVIIGDGAIIHPHVVIYANAQIGNNCILHSGCTIREWTRVGDDCFIQNGAVIGGDGFGYIPDAKIGHKRLIHTGYTDLANNVDVGVNATIDNAMIGCTYIGAGTKIDNLVQVGHNVRIGKACLLCSQVGVSGSSTIGDNVILAGQVGVVDHITIGDNSRVSAQAGVINDIEANTDLMGYPAIKAMTWKRIQILISKLPEIAKRISALEKKI